MIELKYLKKLPQRQDSVIAQLIDLYDVANKLGMYDAADVLHNILFKSRKVEGEAMSISEKTIVPAETTLCSE